MHASLSATGTPQQRRKNLKVTFVTDGTWFSIQGDHKHETGIDLHLSTDGDNAEVTVQSDKEGATLPDLRIYRNHSA